MSYILDAIKKADEKRKEEGIPDVHPVHEPPDAEPRRPGWIYGLAFILFLNAGVIGWWLWPGGPAPKVPGKQTSEKSMAHQPAPKPLPPPTQVAVQPVPPPTPAQIATKPVSPPPPAQAVTTPKPQVAAQPKATAKPPSLSPPLPAKAKPVAVGGAAAPPPRAMVPVQVAASAPQLPNVQVSTPEALIAEEAIDSTEDDLTEDEEGALMESEEGALMEDEEGVETAEAVAAPEAVPEPATKAQKAKAMRAIKEGEDPELAKIPYLKQLPPEVRQTIPELRISFHSYSIKPASRLVSIGGKILREGQDFDGNVKLETITVKGVIMVVNDRRFRIDL